MLRLMSAIHVVLVLGTCATAGSAAVVLTGLSKLYPHLSNFNRFKFQEVQDGRISITGFADSIQSAIHVVFVLGTCATTGSAAVVQPGLSKL